VQRSAERRLEAHAVPFHPREVPLGLPDGQARERFVGEAIGDLEQVLPVFLFRVRIGERVERPLVHRAHVARMAAVAALEGGRVRLADQNSRPRLRA
jgi:hypothetical protein